VNVRAVGTGEKGGGGGSKKIQTKMLDGPGADQAKRDRRFKGIPTPWMEAFPSVANYRTGADGRFPYALITTAPVR
jgi:hypothetical protein